MFKFSAKQRLAIKSYFHALPASLGVYLFPYLWNVIASKTPHFDWHIIALALATALLAPITRWLVRVYQSLVVKYPWLKPFFNKAIVKLKVTPAEAAFIKTVLATAQQTQTSSDAEKVQSVISNVTSLEPKQPAEPYDPQAPKVGIQ